MSDSVAEHYIAKVEEKQRVIEHQAEQIQQRDDSIKLYKATLVQNGLDMTGMRDENQRLKECAEMGLEANAEKAKEIKRLKDALETIKELPTDCGGGCGSPCCGCITTATFKAEQALKG